MGSRKKLLWVVGLLVLLYACLNGLALFISHRILYQPPQRGTARIPHSFFLKTPGGDIQAVYFYNKKAKETILYSHGNAVDLRTSARFLQALYKLGYSVVSYDYNGYGLSAGAPSEINIKNDIDAVYQHMVTHLGIKAQHIILLAHSLGTGPTVYLAAHKKVNRVILLSPFLSVFRTKIPLVFPPFFGDSFNSAKQAPNILSPTIIIHGKADRVILVGNGEKLYQLLTVPKRLYLLNNVGHAIPFNYIAQALKEKVAD